MLLAFYAIVSLNSFISYYTTNQKFAVSKIFL